MKFSVAGLLVICAISLNSWQTNAADLEISIPIQLTHAQNFDPAPSPDGKKLVFISMLSGKEQLFTMDADGKNIAQLTRDDADHEDPAWSPDGRKIAFVFITKERTSIAVMNADGSNVELLTPKEHHTIHPNWSADSKQVMYCTNDDLAPPKKNEAQINVGDLATKKITPVVTGGINTYGSWSPDMKQIAFRKIIGEENSEVFVASADGSNQRNLTNNPFFDGWPAWSPDGRLSDFCNGRGWRQRASHRQHGRARDRTALVAGREDDLFHQLRGERLRNGLRDINGGVRTEAVEGELSLPAGTAAATTNGRRGACHFDSSVASGTAACTTLSPIFGGEFVCGHAFLASRRADCQTAGFAVGVGLKCDFPKTVEG